MRRVDREHPGCFFFLIDLSDSMNDPFGGEGERTASSKPPSKADRLATAINRVFSDLIDECTKDISGIPRYYFDIGVIGYGEQVGPAFASRVSVGFRPIMEDWAKITPSPTVKGIVVRAGLPFQGSSHLSSHLEL